MTCPNGYGHCIYTTCNVTCNKGYLSLQAPNGGCIKDLVPPELKSKYIYQSKNRIGGTLGTGVVVFVLIFLLCSFYYYCWSWLHTIVLRNCRMATIYTYVKDIVFIPRSTWHGKTVDGIAFIQCAMWHVKTVKDIVLIPRATWYVATVKSMTCFFPRYF